MENSKFDGKAGIIIVGEGIVNGKQESYGSFLPKDIPKDLTLPNGIIKKLAYANLCIGELKGLARNISKDVLELFIRAYKRREAWLSTKIEGTNVSLTDVFLSESGSLEKRGFQDIKEIKNYISALDNALDRISKGMDINKDLVNEMHYTLLQGVRGSNKLLGDYRKIQNWIDGADWKNASFIPPHANKVDRLMEHMFSYMKQEDEMPRLIKIGLMHYYFETIHPYEDGNGRLGRTLIALYLMKMGIIEQPILYISQYFEKNTKRYCQLLTKTREDGDYLAWLDFFLDGICETSTETSKKIEKLIDLYDHYDGKLQDVNARTISFKLLDLFFENPYRSIPRIQKHLKKNYPLIKRGIDDLMEAGIVREYTFRRRNKFYVAKEIERILQEN